MFERICLTWQVGRAMVTYKIDANERLIRTQCIGPVTLAEVVAHFQELAADPACPNFLDVLLDLRTIDSLPHSGQLEAVTRAVRKVQSKVRFGVCAIVVERDAVSACSACLKSWLRTTSPPSASSVPPPKPKPGWPPKDCRQNRPFDLRPTAETSG
jgi:hypothetical protein